MFLNNLNQTYSVVRNRLTGHQEHDLECEHGNKRVCIWCGKRVNHSVHYIWLKRVLNKAVKENNEDLKSGKFDEYSDDVFVKVWYRETEYHIKASTILLYSKNDYTKDTMDLLQQGVVKIKKYMKNQ